VIFQLLGFSLIVKKQTLDLEVLNFEHC